MTTHIGIDPGTTKSCGIVVFNDYTKSIQNFDFNDPLSSPLHWIRDILLKFEDIENKKIYIEDCVMGYKTKSSGVNAKLDSIVKQLLQDYQGSRIVLKQDWIKLFKGLPAEVNMKTMKPTKYIDLIALAHLQVKINTEFWSEHERSALCIFIQGMSQFKFETERM